MLWDKNKDILQNCFFNAHTQYILGDTWYDLAFRCFVSLADKGSIYAQTLLKKRGRGAAQTKPDVL